MNIRKIKEALNLNELGQEMYRMIAKLYPICRSITGNGLRETLNIIKEHISLEVKEIPTGTKVFDWTIPKEWNIRDAYVKDSNGDKIIDFNASNLHVVSYSVPINKKVSLTELKKHVFTLPDHPDWIPYRTSYYKEDWGFCVSHNQLSRLKDEEYEVCIDSSLKEGYLTYGECYVRGHTEKEVLISCHACHPSLCNDNLSGIALATFLAKALSLASLRYSYRFLFIPGTIGSIAWLSVNEQNTSLIKHGLVVACVGDSGKITYKKSRRGVAEIDKAVNQVLKDFCQDFNVIEFFPYGYDERQYCSPGFNLPVGCIMRTPHGQFTEYHTSADNLAFIKPDSIADSFLKCLSVLITLEENKNYIGTNLKCEPQLGKRGVYSTTGGQNEQKINQIALLWVLNLSDGNHSLLDIAEKSGLKFEIVKDAADRLIGCGLLKEYKTDSFVLK